MSKKSETRIFGLIETLIEKIDSLESRLLSRDCPVPEDDKRLWTPKDVFRKFGVGERQQYNLRKKGVLPYVQKYPGGPIGYLPPDVIGYFLGDMP